MISSIKARPLAVIAFCAAILSVVIPDAGYGVATAAGLFDPASVAETRSVGPRIAAGGTMRDGLRGTNDVNLRERIVNLNANELARIVPLDANHASDRLNRTENLGRSLTLDLFPGVSVTVPRTSVEAPDDGGFIWAGEVEGMQPAFVTLVISNNEVYGQIQTGGKLYSIEPASGRLHRIIEINQAKIRGDMHATPISRSRAERGVVLGPASDPRAKTTIKVLVANTVNARGECREGTVAQKKSCMQARIALAVKLANDAFTRSGVLITFLRVGGPLEVSYNEIGLYGPNNYVGVLCDLSGFTYDGACPVKNSQPYKFTSVRLKRDQSKADLVILMRKGGINCGTTWGAIPEPSDEYAGFSVVTSSPYYGCIEGNTFAHETGHNLGMYHDRIQHARDYGFGYPDASRYEFGHVNTTKKFMTIMSYGPTCRGCTVIPYHSTPLKAYKGTLIGVAQGTGGPFGAADGVRMMNESRTIVGGYRTP